MPLQSLRQYLATFGHFSRNARLFLAATLLTGAGWGVTGVLFNLYLLNLGHGEALLGDLVFTASVVSMLIAVPIGWASDRWGRRPLLVAAVPIAVAGAAGQVLFPTVGPLVAMTAVGALGTTIASTVSAPLLMAYSTERERNHLFSAFQATMTGATVIGNLLGGLLPGLLGALGLVELAAQRWSLLTSAGLGALALVPVLLIREHPEDRRPGAGAAPGTGGTGPPGPAAPAGTFLGTAAPLIASQWLISVGAGLFVPFYNVFLARHLGATTEQVGAILSATWFAGALALLGAPWVARRLGAIRSVVALQGSSLPFLLAMALVPSLPAVAVAGVVRSSLMNAGNPNFSAFAMAAVPESRRGSLNSLLTLFWNLGWAVGAPVASRLMGVSYTLPYFIAFGLYTAGVLMLYVRFARRESQAPAAAGAP